MALYLGTNKVKINVDGKTYRLNLLSTIPTIIGTRLLTPDDYILKDINGLYITAKESE